MRPSTAKKMRVAGNLLFYIYLAAMSYFLFFSEMMGRTEPGAVYRYNFRLFNEIRRYFQYIDRFSFSQFVINIFGNVLVFVPFGFFLPVLYKSSQSFFTVVMWSAVTSLSIETIQLISRVGIFDVDDILLNTLGGIAGYILYSVCIRIYRAIIKKKRKNSGS